MRPKASLSLTSTVNREVPANLQGELTNQGGKCQRVAQLHPDGTEHVTVEHREFRISPSPPQLLCFKLNLSSVLDLEISYLGHCLCPQLERNYIL